MTPEEELAGLIREALLSHIALSDVMMDSVEHEALAREILSSGFVERMRRSPMQWRDDPLRDMFVIWSREHHAYWRPGSAGYCAELFGAGLYTQAEAVEICSNAEKQNVMSDARGAFDQLMQAISREALLSVAFQHFRQAAEQARLAAYAECAGIADRRVSYPDECECLGPMDWETGARECSLEVRGSDCLCAQRIEEAELIATRIRGGGSAPPDDPSERIIANLAGILRQMIYRASKGLPLDGWLASANEYIARNNLDGSILRAAANQEKQRCAHCGGRGFEFDYAEQGGAIVAMPGPLCTHCNGSGVFATPSQGDRDEG